MAAASATGADAAGVAWRWYRQGMQRISVVAAMVVLARPALAERLRAPDGTVREVPEASVEYALKDGYQRLPQVWIRSPQGEAMLMDEDLASAAERIGAWRMTPEEIRNELERRRMTSEVEKAAAEREAEARKPGWLEAPPEEYGDWRHREVKWVIDPSEIATLLHLGYVRLTEDEHERLMNNRERADKEDADRDRADSNVLAAEILGGGAVCLAVALLVRRRLRAS